MKPPELFEREPPVYLAKCLTESDTNPAGTDLSTKVNSLAHVTGVKGSQASEMAELRHHTT